MPRLDQVIAELPALRLLRAGLAAQGDGSGGAWAMRQGRGAPIARFARDYPDERAGARGAVAERAQALDEGNQIEAAVDFLALADRFPSSERAPQALYAVGLGAVTKELLRPGGCRL